MLITRVNREAKNIFYRWKTYYTLSYQLPLDNVVTNEGANHTLRVNFIDYIYDNLVIKEATVKIILPEGAVIRSVLYPFDVERLPDQVKLTFLNRVNRTIITMKKSNLVEEHIQKVQVHYYYNSLWQLKEPILYFGFYLFLTIVIAIMFYVYWRMSCLPRSTKKTN